MYFKMIFFHRFILILIVLGIIIVKVHCKTEQTPKQPVPQPSIYGTFKHSSLLRVNSEADATPQSIFLFVKYHLVIENEFSFSPQQLDFGNVEMFVPIEATVRLASYYHENDKIISSVSSSIGLIIHPMPVYTFSYGEVKELQIRFIPYQLGSQSITITFSSPTETLSYLVTATVFESTTKLQPLINYNTYINETLEATLEMHNPFEKELNIHEMYSTDNRIELTSDNISILWLIPSKHSAIIIKVKVIDKEETSVVGYLYIHTNYGIFAIPIQINIIPPKQKYKTLHVDIPYMDINGVEVRNLFSPFKENKFNIKLTCDKCLCDIVTVTKFRETKESEKNLYQFAEVVIKGCMTGRYEIFVYVYTDNSNKELDSVLQINVNVFKGYLRYDRGKTYIGVNVYTKFGSFSDYLLPITNSYNDSFTITGIKSSNMRYLTVIMKNLTFPYVWQAYSQFKLNVRFNTSDRWLSTIINVTIITKEKDFVIPYTVYNGYPLLARTEEEPLLTNPLNDKIYNKPIQPYSYAFVTTPAVERPLICLFGKIALGEKRYRTVVLINSNPISLTVDYGTPPIPGIKYYAKALVKGMGNFTGIPRDKPPQNLKRFHIQPNETEFTLYPNDGLYIIIEVTAHPNHTIDSDLVEAFKVKEKWAEPHALILPMADKYGKYFSQLYVLVGYTPVSGSVKYIPPSASLSSIFQGEIEHIAVSMVSSFPEDLHIKSHNVTDSRLQLIVDKNIIKANDFTVIGYLTFDPKTICKLSYEICDYVLSGTRISVEDYEKEPFMFHSLTEMNNYNKRYKDYSKKGNYFSSIVRIDTDELSNINLPVQVKIEFPSIVKAVKKLYHFPATAVSDTSNITIDVVNPTNRTGVFQLFIPSWLKCDNIKLPSNFSKPFILHPKEILHTLPLFFKPTETKYYNCTIILRSSIAPPVSFNLDGEGEIERIEFKRFVGYPINGFENLDEIMSNGITTALIDDLLKFYTYLPPDLNETITILDFNINNKTLLPVANNTNKVWGLSKLVGFENVGNLTADVIGATLKLYGFKPYYIDMHKNRTKMHLKPKQSSNLLLRYEPSCKYLHEYSELILHTTTNNFTLILRGNLDMDLVELCVEGRYNRHMLIYSSYKWLVLKCIFFIELLYIIITSCDVFSIISSCLSARNEKPKHHVHRHTEDNSQNNNNNNNNPSYSSKKVKNGKVMKKTSKSSNNEEKSDNNNNNNNKDINANAKVENVENKELNKDENIIEENDNDNDNDSESSSSYSSTSWPSVHQESPMTDINSRKSNKASSSLSPPLITSSSPIFNPTIGPPSKQKENNYNIFNNMETDILTPKDNNDYISQTRFVEGADVAPLYSLGDTEPISYGQFPNYHRRLHNQPNTTATTIPSQIPPPLQYVQQPQLQPLPQQQQQQQQPRYYTLPNFQDNISPMPINTPNNPSNSNTYISPLNQVPPQSISPNIMSNDYISSSTSLPYYSQTYYSQIPLQQQPQQPQPPSAISNPPINLIPVTLKENNDIMRGMEISNTNQDKINLSNKLQTIDDSIVKISDGNNNNNNNNNNNVYEEGRIDETNYYTPESLYYTNDVNTAAVYGDTIYTDGNGQYYIATTSVYNNEDGGYYTTYTPVIRRDDGSFSEVMEVPPGFNFSTAEVNTNQQNNNIFINPSLSRSEKSNDEPK